MNTIHKICIFIWALVTTRPRIALANETATEGMIGIANELTAGEWIQLTPLGDFPHSMGMQRVDKAAIEAMANNFNSALARVGRALFGGVPFYVGHPDVPQLANEYPDRKAYGWVKALEARADGLHAQVEWSEPGKALLANKHYKFFSPYWDARTVGTEKGKTVYQPTKLLSVGLTNQPNLPVKPLANEKDTQMKPTMEIAALVALLGLANTATEAEVTTEINRIKTEAGKVTGLANEKTTAATALQNEQSAHSTTKTTLANVIKQRNTLALDNAVKAGKITAAQRAEWETKLTDNWDENSKALENTKTVVKTEAKTAGMGGRRGMLANEGDVRTRQQKVQGLVNAKMKAGMDYDSAYAAVKTEHAQLFNEMVEPESDSSAEGARE
jgi:phage I-like protein